MTNICVLLKHFYNPNPSMMSICYLKIRNKGGVNSEFNRQNYMCKSWRQKWYVTYKALSLVEGIFNSIHICIHIPHQNIWIVEKLLMLTLFVAVVLFQLGWSGLHYNMIVLWPLNLCSWNKCELAVDSSLKMFCIHM